MIGEFPSPPAGSPAPDTGPITPSGEAGEVLLRARALRRRFGGLHAVRGVDLELRRGEVLGLLGPNGAGKSTTLHMLAGVLAPTSGRVEVMGIDLLEHPREAKRRLGYLPEQPPLYPELTVEEYLRFCARLRGLASGAGRAAVDRAVERCGLGGMEGRLLGNLSKGYQQRVGIAQAVLHQPPVVILDEPTVGLDPNQIREIRELVRELGSDHGVILSTHILPEVQSVCDRVQILHRGKLVLSESVAHITSARGRPTTRLGLSRPPAPEVLRDLPGVLEVEILGEGRFRLVHEGGTQTAEIIAQAAVTRGWGLHELHAEPHSLEETFVALTCGEPPAGAETRDAGAGSP